MMERKFKVGDRVRDEDFGDGTVMFDDGSDFVPLIVEFDNLVDCTAKDFKAGYSMWMEAYDLKLIADQ